MKEVLSNQLINADKKELAQKSIRVLTDFGFTWKEIAFLTKIEKKKIITIGKGKTISNELPIEVINNELGKLIERFGLNNTTHYSELCLEDIFRLKLDVNSIALYKGTNDGQIFIQIGGIKAINKS
jgi:hypothetical protein